MMNTNPATISALVISGIALIIVIVSMATDYWSTAELTLVSYNRGLWKGCACSFEVCSCGSLPNEPDWFKAVQACVCLAFIANLSAVAALVAFAFTSFFPLRTLQNIADIVLISGACLAAVAVAVYAVKDRDSGFDLGYSWGLMIGAAVLSFIGFINTTKLSTTGVGPTGQV